MYKKIYNYKKIPLNTKNIFWVLFLQAQNEKSGSDCCFDFETLKIQTNLVFLAGL